MKTTKKLTICPNGVKCTTCRMEDYPKKKTKKSFIKKLADYLNNGGTIKDLPRKKGGSTEPF